MEALGGALDHGPTTGGGWQVRRCCRRAVRERPVEPGAARTGSMAP
ncbi:hypothetical protein NKH77_01255 [Streptomyces sp. M19]